MSNSTKTGLYLNMIELKRKMAKPLEQMVFFTIYDHPSDFPNSFVLRKWSIVKGVPEPVPSFNAVITTELYVLHNMIPITAINLGRNESDDAVILETWVM